MECYAGEAWGGRREGALTFIPGGLSEAGICTWLDLPAGAEVLEELASLPCRPPGYCQRGCCGSGWVGGGPWRGNL